MLQLNKCYLTLFPAQNMMYKHLDLVKGCVNLVTVSILIGVGLVHMLHSMTIMAINPWPTQFASTEPHQLIDYIQIIIFQITIIVKGIMVGLFTIEMRGVGIIIIITIIIIIISVIVNLTLLI